MNKIFLSLCALAFIGEASYAQQSGKVGINTENPEATLHIKSKNQSFSGDTDVLKLESGRTKIFSVLDNGNVGIGDLKPTVPLDVDGGARFKTLFKPALTLTDHRASTVTEFAQKDIGMLEISGSSILGSTITLKHRTNPITDSSVGINMSNYDNIPKATLDINGNLKVRNIPHAGRKTDMFLTAVDGEIKYTPYSVAMSPNITYVTGDYTLRGSDSYVIVDSRTPVTITIDNAIIGHLVDASIIKVIQKGVGQVTIKTNGLQVQSARGTKTRAQFSGLEILLIKKDASCIILGDATY